VLVFVFLGVRQWLLQDWGRESSLADPDSGVDALAQVQFGMKDGAATLRRELASFPTDAPLLVIGKGDDWRLTEAYYLLSYLAWPRPVWCKGFTPDGRPAKFENPPPPGVKPVAMFVFNLPLPPGATARPLGDRLGVMPAPR